VKPVDIGGHQITEAVSRKLGISLLEAAALRRRLMEQQSSAVAGAGAGAATNTSASAKRDPVAQAVFDATRGTMEELGREIALCLRYYSVTFRGQRPTRVKLIGGEASDPDLLASLQAALPIPADAGRPLHSIDTSRMKPDDRRGYMSEWAVALGLGLKLTTGHYGARDGRPRDPNAPRNDIPAQVVDLNQAVQTAGAGQAASAAAIPAAAAEAAKPVERE